jgi:regulator of RNase E activity RraB
MKGLSKDIEIAVSTVIEGLEYETDMSLIDADKVKTIVKAKVDSFKYGKDLLVRWQNSNNAPSDETLKKYVRRLVKAGDIALKVLRNALRSKIDYDELDPSKHHLAISVKPSIHQAIVEIDSSLIELRLQIDADNINLKDNEFKRGYPEKFASGEFLPAKDYYKEWYDKENDAIILDPKGTKGEMIKVGDLNIILPEVPEKKNILFSKLKKEEQYWRRQEVPSGLSQDTAESYTEYIIEEFRRRREGIWFMNNGKAEYLTGTHYFALQWIKMEDSGGYMDFRYAQRDMFYFTQACIVDDRCLGELFVKSRRTGYTYQILCQLLNDATSVSNARLGITSKSNDDAEKAFSKLSYGFLNLPFFFKPIVKGVEDSKKFLEFAKPSDRTKTGKKKKDTNTDDYLNTLVDYLPTKNDSYDGQKMFRYLGDECFAKGTKILMSDMSFKNIEDIKVGDYVIVEGGKVMKVKKSSNGYDDLYIVKQPYGKDYIVNSRHKLYFSHGNGKDKKEILKITPVDFLNLSDYKKRITNGVKFSGIEFKEKKFIINPYILGCWLGDGYSYGFSLIVNHNKDEEIISEFTKFANQLNEEIVITKRKDNKNVSVISINDKNRRGGMSFLNKELRRLELIKNKHIPKEYFFSSKKQRLELLAGIIDTDGYINKGSYVIGMSRLNLIEDIYNLAKSCGLDVSEIKTYKSNYNTNVYSLRITKNSKIKCRLKRKQTKDVDFYVSRRNKISVEYYSYGEYYGIELDADNDDDKRLILEDYTISMNCSKWSKPANFLKHWGQVSPTFDTGGRIVGKAFVGSTVAAMKDGGEEYFELYKSSLIKKRNKITGRTPSGLYTYFLPAHKNMEEFTDKYGVCHEVIDKSNGFYNVQGQWKTIGSIQFLEAKRMSKKKENDISYNEELRAFPMTIEEAFRDELLQSTFNIEKILSQIKINEDHEIDKVLVRGNFQWKDGIPDTIVEWYPNEKGRFLVSWIPSEEMRNKYEWKNIYGDYSRFPSNEDIGAFGCDPYDISTTVEGVRKDGSYDEDNNRSSKGALHGLTSTSFSNAPNNSFFLEYVARPRTAEMFFEDVLMACVFYGMPILAENNKPRLLYHFKNRGYRGYSITRPDKAENRLSPTEKELGGMPNSSEDVKQMHATAIESYIEKYVGDYEDNEEIPKNMPFNFTLRDWTKFEVNNRTKYDASISSGLAIMAVNRKMYQPRQKEVKDITINLRLYNK